MDIATVDLNLLVAFGALLAERNVTRAGKRIGLSQSAMSGALGRLRALFDDPLFIRSATGMLPTPRAVGLGAVVTRALGDLQRALDEEAAFDPAASVRRFTLAASDPAMAAVLPGLVARLRARAPGVTLRVLAMPDHEPPPGIEAGSVDLGVGLVRRVPAGHRTRVLYREDMVSLVRADHPAGDRLSLREYLAAAHVLISPKGADRGAIDALLEERGQKRAIAVFVPNLAGAAVLVRRSDLVVTVGARVAASLAGDPGLRVVKVPLELPSHEVSLVWHERSQRDPAHAWLRAEIYAAVRSPAARPVRRARR